MNSRVSVDAEREMRGGEGGGGQDPQHDYQVPPSLTHDGQGGNVVLVLPPKDNNLMAHSSTSDECIPIMVNDIPVYISHTSTGSPLYIRQYPPTLEEIMVSSPQDLVANFDGFSEASGQTFEGFSETSCSSVLFEGFSEDGLEIPKFSVIRNLGNISGKDFENTFADDYGHSQAPQKSPSKKKGSPKSSKKSNSHIDASKGSPERRKRSRSSNTPLQKRIKQEGITGDSSVTCKSPRAISQTTTAIHSPNKRRQSTDKQERQPPECPVAELQGKKPRKPPSPEDPDYIGERCNDIGCTVSFLERMAIKEVRICNGVVQELSDFASQILWDKEFVVRWLQRLNGVRTEEPVDHGDLKSIQTVLKRRKALATIHSGNPLIKLKLKSFDDTEFVLPSIAKRQHEGIEDNLKSFRAIQSTDDEASSVESELAMDIRFHPNENDDNEEVLVPETRKAEVAAEIVKEQGKSRRGVKRATHEKENESKRHVKERRISIEISQNQTGNTVHKTEEKKVAKGKIEENSNKERKEAADKIERNSSNKNKQFNAVNSQVEEKKIIEKDEEQQPTGEVDKYSKKERRITTRRASMVLTRVEKEKQLTANEEIKQVVEKTKKDRRASIRDSNTPLQEEKHNEKGSRLVTNKKKMQAENEEMKVQDNKEHKLHLDTKENNDKRKKKKATYGERENQTIEGEEEPADKTEQESKAKTRANSRKASTLLDKHEKEKKTVNEDGKTTEPENELISDIKVEKKVSIRRASMLARQKEKQGIETEVTKESCDLSKGECKKSQEIKEQSAVRSEKDGERSKRPVKRASLTTTEGEKQFTHTQEIQDTVKQENEAVVISETGTKRERARSRRGSLVITKQKDVTSKEVGRSIGSRRKSLTTKTMQEDEKQMHETGENRELEKQVAPTGEKEYQDTGIDGRLQATHTEEGSVEKDTKQAVEKTGRGIRKNRRSRSRKRSVIISAIRGEETSDKGVEKIDKEAKNVQIGKQKRKLKEQETSDKEKGECTTDTEIHTGSVERLEAADEHRSEKEGQRSIKKEKQQDEMENAITLLSKDIINEEEKDELYSVKEKKKKTEKGQENKVNENLGSEENQIVLKRNKVINRDKRISRWQNRKMHKYEEKTISNQEVTSHPEQMSNNEDSQSDEGDGNLVIDEGDSSMLSDLSEYNLHIEEGDSSMQSDPAFSTPRKKGMSMSDSEVIVSERRQKGKRRQMKGDGTEEPLPGKNNNILTRDEETWENQDLEGKQTSPRDATTPGSTEPSLKPQGTESSYDGTLGVSKSGRLRKASAKGIQSIEIKCLFMQRSSEAPRPPPPLPALKNERKDKDWVQEKRSPVKNERREKDSGQEKRSPVKHERKDKNSVQEKRSPVKNELGKKSSLGIKVRRPIHKYCRAETEYITYTYKEGHLVPRFKETDHYLGDFCAAAGVTVDDLNSDEVKKVKMTFGMIKELHDFYTTRMATKTSLAIKLFKMNGRKILDNTHLLSTVIRLTAVGAMKNSDKQRLRREFTLPVRTTYRGPPEEEKTEKVPERPESEKSETSSGVGVTSPSRVRRSIKKRGVKPEDSGDEECSDSINMEEDEDLNEILVTRGEKGSITRGDIVHLYTKWLRNKMSLSSNTFVTDLLKSVEQLMAERCVAPIRIPAGTLMSSSVRLHDEYKQILRLSKEDAIMYLQEDWLEDITYLLSISAPSRRNTTEGEATSGGAGEVDISTVEKPAKAKTIRRRSGGSKEEEISNFRGEPLSNTVPFRSTAKTEVSRGHQMESVGKRQGKRRSIRKSLQDYERDILQELEKAGMLEEDEEDILSQLDREEEESESEKEEKENEDKKKDRQHKKQRGEKKPEGGIDKNVQKESTSIKETGKPVDDSDFEVEKIVDYQEIHDSRGKRLRYLVRWVGLNSDDDSWVDESNLQCPSLLEAFWKRKKNTGRSDKFHTSVENDHKSPKQTGHSKPKSPLKDRKESEESIIQVMVKHGSSQHTTSSNTDSPVVTKRELLSLYDSWRQENQDDLIAGGSNTVNVEVFKSRVKDLMTSRNVECHPESLLNACFMMTLMKTRLQSKMAIDRFLDTSCLEVLESSHRQYLKRKYSLIEEVPSPKSFEDQKQTVLSLQNELHSLKLDLTTAQKWRAVKNSQLGAVEEEVDYLETAVDMPNIKKSKKVLYFKKELQKLKNDIKILEKYQRQDSEGKDAKRIEVPLFDNVSTDQENYKRNSKIVRNKLLSLNISKSMVGTIMDVVAQRVSSQLMQE